MKTDFKTFKSGDVVRVRKDFPYINRDLLFDETYVIDKMLDTAGVVTLVGQQSNITFPDDAFELVYGVEDGEEDKD